MRYKAAIKNRFDSPMWDIEYFKFNEFTDLWTSYHGKDHVGYNINKISVAQGKHKAIALAKTTMKAWVKEDDFVPEVVGVYV